MFYKRARFGVIQAQNCPPNMLIKFSMVSPLGVVRKFTAEIAEFAEVFLEFSAVLAGSAVDIHFGLFDNT